MLTCLLVASCLGFPFVLSWTAQWWIVLHTFSYLLLLMEISGSLLGCEGTQLIVHELLSAVLGTLEGKEMVAEQTDYPARQASQAACVSEVLSIIDFLQLQKNIGFVSPHIVIPCIFLHWHIYLYIYIYTYTTFVDVACSLKSTKVQFSVGVVEYFVRWMATVGKDSEYAFCLMLTALWCHFDVIFFNLNIQNHCRSQKGFSSRACTLLSSLLLLSANQNPHGLSAVDHGSGCRHPKNDGCKMNCSFATFLSHHKCIHR